MKRILGGFRQPILFLAVVVLASVTPLEALQASGAGTLSEEPAEQLLLRLHDLPPGYIPLNLTETDETDLFCEDLEPSNPSPRMIHFVKRFSPHGCLGIYVRAYRAPDEPPSPAVVGTGALDAGSGEGAESGFSLAGALLGRLTENEVPAEVPPATTIGDATRLFHWKRAPDLFHNGHLGSFLVWRSGAVLAAVFASAGSLASSDSLAEALAQRQQAHIEEPTPYTRAERNDSEVGLDDPALKLPVYWLGRNFAPGHGLPVARLKWGGRLGDSPGELPDQEVELRYSHELNLSSWTKAGWRRFRASREGRQILGGDPCLETADLAFDGGRATIYAGHFEGFISCASNSPRRFFAVVHLGGIVVGVRVSSCLDCPESPRRSYNSLAGMKTVVRALRLRPEPSY